MIGKCPDRHWARTYYRSFVNGEQDHERRGLFQIVKVMIRYSDMIWWEPRVSLSRAVTAIYRKSPYQSTNQYVMSVALDHLLDIFILFQMYIAGLDSNEDSPGN
ncbi:hypothetical protein BX666DRAFT_1874472 [Dichotomocladium elegans]|nr:hypothetical protein BX666DRAFT_1874472 [Dichotomocladium elegans]